MGLIASKRESIGRSGYWHRSDFPDQIQSVKVSNLSRFSALVFYPDGVTPSYAERYFGASRQHHVIVPGGWLMVPVSREPFALGADGILLGDYSLSPNAELSSAVECLIQEFDDVQQYISYKPEQLTIANWTRKSVSADNGWISMQALDPDYKLPQMRGGVLGLKIGNAGTEAGVDGYSYLNVSGRLGITQANDYEYFNIPCGGMKLGGTSGGANFFFQEFFFRIANMEILELITTETGQRSYSGELFWVNKPIRRRTFVDLRAVHSIGATATRQLNRLSTYHLVKVVVTWSQAGAGNGTITAAHVDEDGTVVYTETITATGAGAGSTTINPLAAFINFSMTGGANGSLRTSLTAERLYEI